MPLPLPAVNAENLQFIINQIAAEFPVSGVLRLATVANVKVAYGTSTLVFTASANSAEKTIAHGLGATPGLVLAMVRAGVNARITIEESSAADGTNIYLTGYETASAVITQNQSIYWCALG